jgi:hypothetical protein
MASRSPQLRSAAKRIRGELLKLGIEVAKSTIQRYSSASVQPTATEADEGVAPS